MKHKMAVYQNTLFVACILVAMLIVASLAFSGQTGIQVVTLTPNEVTLKQGASTEFVMEYNVLDGERQTTGLGLRIHFNSSAIAFLFFQDTYIDGLLAQDETAQNDMNDLDNDPSTDKFVSIAWLGINADWPKSKQFPIKLGKIALQVQQHSKTSSTTLNVNSSSTPAVCHRQLCHCLHQVPSSVNRTRTDTVPCSLKSPRRCGCGNWNSN